MQLRVQGWGSCDSRAELCSLGNETYVRWGL